MEVFQPAISIAKNFTVNEDLVYYMTEAVKDSPDKCGFLCKGSWRSIFTEGGKPLKLNQTTSRQNYANTLERIATSNGIDIFYNGTIGNSFVSSIRKTGGLLTQEDLAGYTISTGDVSQAQYRGYDVRSTLVPSSGPVTLSVLNILNGLHGEDFRPGEYNLSTHQLDEAIRFGYAQVRMTL